MEFREMRRFGQALTREECAAILRENGHRKELRWILQMR